MDLRPCGSEEPRDCRKVVSSKDSSFPPEHLKTRAGNLCPPFVTGSHGKASQGGAGLLLACNYSRYADIVRVPGNKQLKRQVIYWQ